MLGEEDHATQLEMLDKASSQPPSAKIIQQVTGASKPLEAQRQKHPFSRAPVDLLDLLREINNQQLQVRQSETQSL